MSGRRPAGEEKAPSPPEGYVPSEGRGGFSTLNGPYFYRLGDGQMAEQTFFALRAMPMAWAWCTAACCRPSWTGCWRAPSGAGRARPRSPSTLSIDFLHMARVGEWVMGEGRVTRITREVAFAEGRAYVGGHDVVRCSGIFKLMSRDR